MSPEPPNTATKADRMHAQDTTSSANHSPTDAEHAQRPPAGGYCDVFVVGGGPGGSTLSTLLARKGHDVVMVEKEHHPRFHIGESLLPANLELFETLGVADEIAEIGIDKWGAEFVSPEHDHTQHYNFGEAWDKSMPKAYEVERAEFDRILFRNAERNEVRTFEGTKVIDIDFHDAARSDDQGREYHATITTQDDTGTQQTWHTAFVADATGRDTFLANRHDWKRRSRKHNSAAVFGHFRNAVRNPGKTEGNITLFWFDHGWFWFIPLKNGVTSVGMVTWPYHMKSRQGRSLEQFLLDNIDTVPELKRRLSQASLVRDVQATGNFSYSADRSHGKRFILVGDAFMFIDPVFSSGVFLAMQSGAFGSEAIDTVLREPAQAEQALTRYDRQVRRGPKEFSWFIYRITKPVMRDLFMAPRNFFRVKEALISLLAADIHRGTPIWPSIRILKGIYYLTSLARLRRAVGDWRAHRRKVRPLTSETDLR
ncbi:NAD(P)/FAD-dependent oxidoreductase [Guyparkeria sp. TX1]|uniref:NAD(P)/FAD-dependent oxidoreductase n=1 Tax=Guyparkeria sp. TX1 TaxID=3115001 RepID=UPI003977CB08